MLRPKCKISPTNRDLAIKIYVSSMIFMAHNISLTVHGSEIKPLIMQLCFDKDVTHFHFFAPHPIIVDIVVFACLRALPSLTLIKDFSPVIFLSSKSLGLCGITKLQDPCTCP